MNSLPLIIDGAFGQFSVGTNRKPFFTGMDLLYFEHSFQLIRFEMNGKKTGNAIQNDTVIVSIRLFSYVRCAFYAISSKYCSIVNVHRNKDERRKQIKEHKIKLR